MVPATGSRNHPNAPVDLSTLVKTARREALRLKRLYGRAMRVNPGTKREKRPGPDADEVFKSLGLAYALDGRRLSRDDRIEVDEELGIESLNAAKKASEWLKSYPAIQASWEATWDDLRKAQRVGQMAAQGLSSRRIQQKCGITTRRLEELTPRILNSNLRLELHARGKRRAFKTLPECSPELQRRVSESIAFIERSIQEREKGKDGHNRV